MLLLLRVVDSFETMMLRLGEWKQRMLLQMIDSFQTALLELAHGQTAMC
jgi:hypothetical protein